MRIAIVTPYRDYPGGVESVNKLLIGLLEEQGHTVDLVTADNFNGSIVDRILVKLIGLPWITAKRFKKLAEAFDLVICNGEHGWGIKHPHCLCLFHGSYLGYRDRLKQQWSLLQYLNLSRYAYIQGVAAKGKYVVAVSSFVADILSSQGINVAQILPNCVDTEKFKPSTTVAKNNKYLFVGASAYYAKGFDVLEKLVELGLKIDCVTGTAPKGTLGWIPNIPREEMPELYPKYRLLVFPSRFEGLALTPLEAMSCGVPVVMSNVGGAQELATRLPEFVVNGHDPDEFVRRAALIEKKYDFFSQQARDYVLKHHSYANYSELWRETIEKVINAKLVN